MGRNVYSDLKTVEGAIKKNRSKLAQSCQKHLDHIVNALEDHLTKLMNDEIRFDAPDSIKSLFWNGILTEVRHRY